MLTDKQDYEEIYQKYKNLVMKAAYKYSGNYDIAEDITQSTFLQLYMYIDELKDINIKAWMYTTAKHMALNYNKKAEREVLSETGEDPAILDLEDSAEDTYMERMKDDEQTSLHEEIFYDGQTGTLKFTQEAFRSPDTSTYYIQNKDRCIGLCHLTLSQGSAYLYGFGILPALQNQGYGRAALRLLYASLPEGTDRLWLQVSSLNEPAFSLYTSEGFQVRSKLDYYY